MILDAWLLPLVPVAGLAAYTLAHLLLSNMQKGRRYLPTLMACGGLGLMVTLLLHHRLAGGDGFTADYLALGAVNLLAYLCLAWCYFHFINIMVASLRIRLLREMGEAGSLSRDNILEHYDARTVITHRLERLVEGGHLVRNADGRLKAGSPFFIIIFDIFQMLKVAILGRGNRILSKRGVDAGGFSASAADLWSIVWTNRFFRFLVVGGINTIFSYLLFGTFIWAGLDYRWTVVVCTVITIIFNFNTIGRIVFEQQDWRLLGRFMAVYGIISLINLFGLQALVERAGFHPMAGQAILIPAIAVVSFVLNRAWVF